MLRAAAAHGLRCVGITLSDGQHDLARERGRAVAFERDEIALFQVLARRAGRPASKAPWSRHWMYERSNGSGNGAPAA